LFLNITKLINSKKLIISKKLIKGSYFFMDTHFFPLESPYIDSFVEFIERHFDAKDNLFVLTCNNTKSKLSATPKNNVVYSPVASNQYRDIFKIINNSHRIFLHSYFGETLNIFSNYSGYKNFMGIFWGSDLAIYIYRNVYDRMDKRTRRFFLGDSDKIILTPYKQLIQEYYTWYKMNAILGKTSYLLGLIKHSSSCLNNIFDANVGILPFSYENPTNIDLLDQTATLDSKYNFKEKYDYTIMVNHSANPANNHITLIDNLANFPDKNFVAITPLSYGAAQNVVEMFIKYGKNKLGDKFMPLTEYLEPVDYLKILRQVDIFMMNSYFSGGFANIRTMFSLEKKIILNKNNKDYFLFFNDNDIKVTFIDSENDEWAENLFTPLDAETSSKNKKISENYFSQQNLVNLYSNIIKATT
jgi:hypothetical protein